MSIGRINRRLSCHFGAEVVEDERGWPERIGELEKVARVGVHADALVLLTGIASTRLIVQWLSASTGGISANKPGTVDPTSCGPLAILHYSVLLCTSSQ